ncbi:unnamed protein product [Toxocara canis]|uniref:Cytochrome P450 n=1 Tax=Toxocara canis TaxID=6265 RepID=A0A183TW41_TOXCA|nr:unnamed protein product [Toxocara canis]
MIGFGEAAAILIFFVCLSFVIFNGTIGGVTCIVALLAYFLWTKRLNEYWIRRGIPAPKPNFFFGNFLQMSKGIHLYDLENAKKYGPVYGGTLIGLRELNVCDVDMLRRILIQDFAAFPNRVIADYFIGNQAIRQNMVNVMRDQHWKDVRKTITPAFTPGRIEKVGCPLVFLAFFGHFSMDVIAQSAFGVDLSTQRDHDSKFVYYAKKMFELKFVDYRIMLLTLFPNLARLVERSFNFQLIGNSCDAFFEDVLRRIVEQRRKNPRKVNPDFLQLLLDTVEGSDSVEVDEELMNEAVASGKKVNGEVALTEGELIAQGYLFLVAGYETTATTLQFIIYSLAANPHVQEIAHKQIVDTVGDKEVIGHDDIMKMPYIEQVMNETLRMYPPVPRNDRKCKSNITLKGTTIEKDTFVFVPTFALHYDERYYPNPQVFDPDRFSPTEKAKRDPLTFVPFGIGPRTCMGMRFAQMEIRLTLAYLLRKFEFSVPEDLLGKPLELDTTGMTKSKGPTFITVKRRN